MFRSSLAVFLVILFVSGPSWAVIPTKWDGNNYSGFGGSSYRFGWLEYELYGFTFEYHCDRISYRFSAGDTASFEAIQLWTSTPSAKLGYNDPELKISIHADNNGIPGAEVASYTGTYQLDALPLSGTGRYTGAITAPLSASLTEGTAYHLVVQCTNMTKSLGQNKEDYPNSAIDFRLSGGGGGLPASQVRIYDGTLDYDMAGLYYNQTPG